MRRALPVPRFLVELACLIFLAAAGAALLPAWLGSELPRGSTEAWLAAFAQRVLLVGDYRAAAAASMVPNTAYDPLYPAAVLALAQLFPSRPLVELGRSLSGASLGLLGYALLRLWGEAAGPLAALAAVLAALLFPPLLVAGAAFRAEALGLALVLLAALASRGLARGGRLAPLLAGLLAGLAYLAREYLLAPALGALAAGLLLRWRRERSARPALLALLGLLPGAVPLPLLLDLAPWNGLAALADYGLGDRGASPPPLPDLLYLRLLPWALAWPAGLLGLLIAARRGREREAPLVLLGTLLPFAAFPLSRQQSPQYYLLAHALLLTGLAGWVLLLPPRAGRPAAGALALALPLLGGRAALEAAPQLLQSGGGNSTPFHSEGWPASPGELDRLAVRLGELVGERPLLVSTSDVENLDAYLELRWGRPVGFLYPDELDRLPRAVEVYRGHPVLLLLVAFARRGMPRPEGGLLAWEWQGRELHARLYVLPGRLPSGGDPCEEPGGVRGACLQRAWLEGGDGAVKRRALQVARRHPGLLGVGPAWW